MAQKKLMDDQSVLEKALLVISEYGPETFTLADVGRAVGLAPATLMQRFGSKQQLILLAAKQANVTLKKDLEKLKNKKLPWSQELLQLLISMPEGFGSRQDIANSLGLLIARQLFESLRQRILELLHIGQSHGEIDESFDIETIGWELDALRHGFVIQWTLSGKGTLKKWLEKSFKTYFERIRI